MFNSYPEEEQQTTTFRDPENPGFNPGDRILRDPGIVSPSNKQSIILTIKWRDLENERNFPYLDILQYTLYDHRINSKSLQTIFITCKQPLTGVEKIQIKTRLKKTQTQ